MMAFFVLWGWYGFVQKKYWIYFISASLAILVKETGLFLPMMFGMHIIWQVFKGDWAKWGIRITVIVLAPVAVLGLFLMIQLTQMGWIFFPYHSSIVVVDVITNWQHMVKYFTFLFMDQGRWFMTVFVIIAIVKAIRSGNGPPDIVRQMGWLLPSLILLSFFGVYLHRYIVYTMPFFCLLGAWTVYYLSAGQWFRFVSLTAVALGGFLFVGVASGFSYDASPNYKHQVRVTQQAVEYVYNHFESEEVFASFPLNRTLLRKEFGYGTFPSFHFSNKSMDSVQYVLLTSPGSYHALDITEMDTLKQFESKWAKATLYKRQNVISTNE